MSILSSGRIRLSQVFSSPPHSSLPYAHPLALPRSSPCPHSDLGGARRGGSGEATMWPAQPPPSLVPSPLPRSSSHRLRSKPLRARAAARGGAAAWPSSNGEAVEGAAGARPPLSQAKAWLGRGYHAARIGSREEQVAPSRKLLWMFNFIIVFVFFV